MLPYPLIAGNNQLVVHLERKSVVAERMKCQAASFLALETIQVNQRKAASNTYLGKNME